MQLVPRANTFILEVTQAEAKGLAKTIIQLAEEAQHGALLDFAYLINEAKYDARYKFRQPPHAWEPGAKHPAANK